MEQMREQFTKALMKLQTLQVDMEYLESVSDKEVTLENISLLIQGLYELKNNVNIVESYITKINSTYNSFIYSRLPFMLARIGVSKFETMELEASDGTTLKFAVSVKSDISIKRLADDETIDAKLNALGYSVSKPSIHAARLKSVVKDALSNGMDISDIVETETKTSVSFKPVN